jgi:protein-tyrosine phosphatase
MGNICRSPSAEGFFRMHLQHSDIAQRVSTDSAGTHSYHIGHAPDDRAISVSAKSGVDIQQLRARKISADDFQEFDLIIAMDYNNLQNIKQLQPSGSKAKIVLMMEYAPDEGFEEVPDPYYGTQDDFTLMCGLLDIATKGLLTQIETEVP